MNNQATVIIPAKVDTAEQLAWLERAIDSAYRNDCRVVVIDDGSIAEFESHHRYEVIGGPGRARNKALEFVTTPYVVPLDADDELLPGAVDNFLAQAGPDRIVYGDCLLGAARRRQQMTNMTSLLCGYSVPAVTALYPIEAIRQAGGWPEDWPAFEDVALWALLLRREIIPVYISVPIFLYNKREDSLSATMDRGAVWARLRATYPAEWAQARMCDCGRGKNKPYQEAISNVQIQNPITLVYIGRRTTAFAFRGPATGNRYHVEPGRELVVELKDRQTMVDGGLFMNSPEIVMAPSEPRREVWEAVIDGTQ